MKYKNLRQTAKEIDHLIDHHLNSTRISAIPQEDLKEIVLKKFPYFYVQNFGSHKIVLGIHSIDQKIVLKVGSKNTIENDHRAYKRLPENMRHALFARIFWHTKYCLLQEYGFSAHVTQEELTRIRRIVNRYGVFDIKAENLRRIDSNLKIVDANVSSIPIPYVLRKIDEVKPYLPKKLNIFFKTITKTLFEK